MSVLPSLQPGSPDHRQAQGLDLFSGGHCTQWPCTCDWAATYSCSDNALTFFAMLILRFQHHQGCVYLLEPATATGDVELYETVQYEDFHKGVRGGCKQGQREHVRL